MSTTTTRGRAVAPLLLLAVVLSGCARLGGEAHQPSHSGALPLSADNPIGQTFTIAGSGLAGFDLLMATFGEPPDPSGTLTVTLRARLDAPVLATAEVTGSAIRDNSWVPVRFDEPQEIGPLAGQPPAVPADAADGAARPVFEVTWDGASPVGVRANVPARPIEPDVLVNDPYPWGELVLDGELAAGDLAFRVLGIDGVAALPRTVRGLAGGAARGLADRPLFAAGWALLLAGSAALAVYGFRAGTHRAGTVADDRDDRDDRDGVVRRS
jgi:hypothetical protein